MVDVKRRMSTVKTALTALLFVALIALVIGGVACALTMPGWLCGLYGVSGAVAVWCVMDCLAVVWTVKACKR